MRYKITFNNCGFKKEMELEMDEWTALSVKCAFKQLLLDTATNVGCTPVFSVEPDPGKVFPLRLSAEDCGGPASAKVVVPKEAWEILYKVRDDLGQWTKDRALLEVSPLKMVKPAD